QLRDLGRHAAMAAAARFRRWPADLHRIRSQHRSRRSAAAVRHRRGRRGRAGQLPRRRPLLCRRPPVRRCRAASRRQAAEGRAHRTYRRAGGGEGLVTETVPRPERAKADPETLALRASPGRVTRFRRGAIIAVAAAASAAIAGVAWLALKPATLGLVAADEERNLLAAKAPADALAGAPASYGDVPQLGPPLPGDLGKPILDHQREMGMATLADPASEAAARAAQEAETKRQRIAAEKRAARESGIILPLAGRSRAASAPADDAPAPGRSPAEGSRAPDPDPSGQQRRNEPVGGANRDDRINPHVLVQPVSPWTLHAGSVIAASL